MNTSRKTGKDTDEHHLPILYNKHQRDQEEKPIQKRHDQLLLS